MEPGALGVIAARRNTVGIMGIAPAAGPLRLASVWNGSTPGHVVDALVRLMTLLSPGDIVMLELQTARGNISGWPDNHPIEIKDAERDAIRLAVSQHNLVVVTAAGNAGVDLDAYVSPQGTFAGRRLLDRNSADFQDSGSIMVGAATSTVPHRRMNSMDNKSNFGSRVDCYAWGENVSTCGAALVPDFNTHANRWYRTEYNATSAATPIVAGAATLLQGIYKATTGVALPGLKTRALLSDPAYGTAPEPKIGAKIGVMPNLQKLIPALAEYYPEAKTLRSAPTGRTIIGKLLTWAERWGLKCRCRSLEQAKQDRR
jgi:Subtilase family